MGWRQRRQRSRVPAGGGLSSPGAAGPEKALLFFLFIFCCLDWVRLSFFLSLSLSLLFFYSYFAWGYAFTVVDGMQFGGRGIEDDYRFLGHVEVENTYQKC